MGYILAIDQGTTSSRAVVFGEDYSVVGMSQKEYRQIFPKSGWVEHDPMEIFSSQYAVITEVLMQNGIDVSEIDAIGIANQRETTVVWDKNTGKPVCNAIVWQCRRTADICEEYVKNGYADYIKEKTGLLIDAYFSATKIKWILDNVEGAREAANKGDLLFGTVDTWLIWKLTGGMVHATDYTNASRTMLFDIHNLCWDPELLRLFGIPESMMPEVLPSNADFGYAEILGSKIHITGVAGDQQAAMFGHGCINKGDAKCTYGTGCFMLMNTGDTAVDSTNGLLTTLCASGKNGKPYYAIEGSVFTGGSVIKWLRDEMGLIRESADCEYFARKVENNGGVYFVPAFTGLGAPYWNMYAKGAVYGLSRGTGRNHIIRAALESIAYQTKDVLDAMVSDTGISIEEIKVDGGASANNFLMQFQADILGTSVVRPLYTEITARGAAMIAAQKVGKSTDVKGESAECFEPEMTQTEKDKCLSGWKTAVKRTLN